MIIHVILFLNERERDLEKKKRKGKKKIGQEDQMLELTFDFSRALSISIFF